MKDYSRYTYVASCVFTRDYPELSFHIQDYLRRRFGIETMRCCVEKYKVSAFERQMRPEVAPKWKALTHFHPVNDGDTMVSVCHNCTSIFQEQHPGVRTISLWELILEDDAFPYPDYGGEAMTVQDCWRQRDNRSEQDAVRELMHRMNIQIVELPDNHERTMFCGVSTLRPQPPRNPILVPERYGRQCPPTFFQPHTEEEQIAAMREYCRRFETAKVVTFCHYCNEGILAGGKEGLHLAQLLFKM